MKRHPPPPRRGYRLRCLCRLIKNQMEGCLAATVFVLRKTFFAINRPVTARLKRNFTFFLAVRAGRLEHLSRTPVKSSTTLLKRHVASRVSLQTHLDSAAKKAWLYYTATYIICVLSSSAKPASRRPKTSPSDSQGMRSRKSFLGQFGMFRNRKRSANQTLDGPHFPLLVRHSK